MALPPIYQAPIDGRERTPPLKVQKTYRAFLPEKADEGTQPDDRRKRRERRQKAIPVSVDRRRGDRRKRDAVKQRLQQAAHKPDSDDRLGQVIDETV